MKKILTTFSFLISTLMIHAQCWTTVATGNAANHSIAVSSSGTLFGWGENVNGQVGDNTTINRTSPAAISTENDWKVVAVNGSHTMAIRLNGELWGWGQNAGGELGDGTADNKLEPTRIGSATDWDTLSAGAGFMHAIKSDGTLWAWGYGGYNQLGVWAGVNVYTPTLVNTATDWKAVSGGVFSAAALKTDGTLWQWGNGYYQGAPSGVPIQIGTDTDWKTIAHGAEHNLALKNNGTLWAWGNNLTGQLGDGTSGGVHTGLPRQIGTDNNWVMIAAGGAASFAIKADGSLWGWGSNAYGQLGDGTTIDKAVPTQIGTDTDWKFIVAGGYYTLAQKNDGTLWGSGLNDKGQLGMGHTTNISTFTPLNCGTVLPITWLSFTATKQGAAAMLTWQTTNEQNTAYFDVERAVFTGGFERIGTVRASGNSIAPTTYNFTDATPLMTANFYRIKQVDNDGTFSYTPVRRVNFDETASSSLVVYPVPASTLLTVSLPQQLAGPTLVTIHSIDGRLVHQQQVSLQGGPLLNVNISALPNGIYQMKAATSQQQVTTKFIKH